MVSSLILVPTLSNESVKSGSNSSSPGHMCVWKIKSLLGCFKDALVFQQHMIDPLLLDSIVIKPSNLFKSNSTTKFKGEHILSSLVTIYTQSSQMLKAVAGPGILIIKLHSTSGTLSGTLSQALKAIIQSNMEKLQKDIFICKKL